MLCQLLSIILSLFVAYEGTEAQIQLPNSLEDLNLPQLVSTAYRYYMGVKYIYCGKYWSILWAVSLMVHLLSQLPGPTSEAERRRVPPMHGQHDSWGEWGPHAKRPAFEYARQVYGSCSTGLRQSNSGQPSESLLRLLLLSSARQIYKFRKMQQVQKWFQLSRLNNKVLPTYPIQISPYFDLANFGKIFELLNQFNPRCLRFGYQL